MIEGSCVLEEMRGYTREHGAEERERDAKTNTRAPEFSEAQQLASFLVFFSSYSFSRNSLRDYKDNSRTTLA